MLAAFACATAQDAPEPKGPKYEARAWLRANQNPSPFASNRFGPKAAAVAFIDSLYNLGADTVYVVDVEEDSSWIRQEGGPYADALWVRLPTDLAVRARLFGVGAREARHEGFDPYADRGQQYLFFWWD
ncbi:MAG TPA: hypothetical protein VM716_00850 [Gemmatimonadales bacterium]|nr:hypothetical protein [Gemmatimonadales bacterium]